VKAESIQIAESIFVDLTAFLNFEAPQTHKNMTIIPITIQDYKFIDFISIKEAEKLDLIEVLETNSVNQLEVINKSNKQVLIPFGMTVHGGKQDRTIWEPILLPAGEKHQVFSKKSNPPIGTNPPPSPNPHPQPYKYSIPAKCIEQSRWNYKKARGFKSSNMRLHPNVAFYAMSPSGQGNVWGEIQSYRSEMRVAPTAAPTQSYLDMTKKSQNKTEEFIKNFTIVQNQCGIACFINNEFIGMEFYANPKAWNSMYTDILNAFAIEALRFRDKPINVGEINYYETLLKLMSQLQVEFSVRKGVGLGDVVEINSNSNKKWRGITLVYDNMPIQFYLVSKRGGSSQARGTHELHFQTNINNRIF
jgi:hypothetical protein